MNHLISQVSSRWRLILLVSTVWSLSRRLSRLSWFMGISGRIYFDYFILGRPTLKVGSTIFCAWGLNFHLFIHLFIHSFIHFKRESGAEACLEPLRSSKCGFNVASSLVPEAVVFLLRGTVAWTCELTQIFPHPKVSLSGYFISATGKETKTVDPINVVRFSNMRVSFSWRKWDH